MNNEVILLLSLIVDFGGTLLLLKLFRKEGMFLWTILATIAANIEVMIVINAFGMEQTLGNVMFASTFLVTDILSECYGKEEAKRAVRLGIATSVFFILVSQTWLLFTPAASDWAMPYISTIFSNTPRMMLAGLIVYVIVQIFDVWAYHKWWAFTEKRFGDRKKWLWLRNNGSTLISQLMNSILFNVFAFWGTYDTATLISIIISTYVIYLICGLLDTPFVYAARTIVEKETNETR